MFNDTFKGCLYNLITDQLFYHKFKQKQEGK